MVGINYPHPTKIGEREEESIHANILLGRGLTQKQMQFLMGGTERVPVIRTEIVDGKVKKRKWQRTDVVSHRIGKIGGTTVGKTFVADNMCNYDRTMEQFIKDYLANKGNIVVYFWDDVIVVCDAEGEPHMLQKRNFLPEYKVQMEATPTRDAWLLKMDCDPSEVWNAEPTFSNGWFYEYNFTDGIYYAYDLRKAFPEKEADMQVQVQMWEAKQCVARNTDASHFQLLVDALTYFFGDGFVTLQVIRSALMSKNVGKIDRWLYETVKHYHGNSIFFTDIMKGLIGVGVLKSYSTGNSVAVSAGKKAIVQWLLDVVDAYTMRVMCPVITK